MKNTLKKVLFSLWSIGLVWLGIYGVANAEIIEQDPTICVGNECIQKEWSRELIDVAINFINRVLWILWVIALAICLRWGFQMVTASWDENKYKKWYTVLKQAWIWLAVIWLSWIIVRLVLWLISTMRSGAWA